jgi:pyochelin synthetase
LLGSNAEYLFTDISPFFLSRARDRFGKFSFVTYGRHDINRAPQLQGLQRHQFDIVLAVSVLHNAQNIINCLEYLRSVIVPGGVLLLIEETRFFPFFDLGMGLQQGFDDFADDLRHEHPLLSRDSWIDLLSTTGFTQPTILNKNGSIAEALHFDLLLAQAPKQANILNESALKRHLAQRLPRAAVPASWIQMEHLPLSSNGKVDRTVLMLPEPRQNETPEHLAPRNETERALAKIIASALGVARVGVRDDFFELGGDSLVASRVVVEIRNLLGVDLRLQVLFEATTIEQLAALCEIVRPTSSTVETVVNGEL